MADTPPATETADTGTVTVLAFSDDDHCRYDPSTILAFLTDAERALVLAALPDAAATWVDSTSLYCAAEELEALGHRDLADTVGQFIHAENLFGCLCRNQALEAFTNEVDAALAEIQDRVPYGTWWTERRLHPHGLHCEALLTDLGWDADRAGDLRFALDRFGNGTVTSGSRSLRVVAFPTPELGAFAQRLEAGEVAADDGSRPGVADLLRLPENVRTAVAALDFHDVPLAANGILGLSRPTSGLLLTLDELVRVASAITDLGAADAAAVMSLLPGTRVPLEELLAALGAAGLPT